MVINMKISMILLKQAFIDKSYMDVYKEYY